MSFFGKKSAMPQTEHHNYRLNNTPQTRSGFARRGLLHCHKSLRRAMIRDMDASTNAIPEDYQTHRFPTAISNDVYETLSAGYRHNGQHFVFDAKDGSWIDPGQHEMMAGHYNIQNEGKNAKLAQLRHQRAVRKRKAKKGKFPFFFF